MSSSKRTTLRVGGVSYCAGFYIALTADKDTYPDLDVLASAMCDELATRAG